MDDRRGASDLFTPYEERPPEVLDDATGRIRAGTRNRRRARRVLLALAVLILLLGGLVLAGLGLVSN